MEVIPVYMLPFSTVFLIFMIYSFVGWCSEVLYVGIFFEHKFVNRGFLYGPVTPIYGCGGLTILLIPQALYHTWIPLFFASMVLCTLVEYAASWLMEKMFHARWWDYSRYKFHINGRVCLLNSVLFGLMGVIDIHFVQPYIMLFINWLGELRIQIVSSVLVVILIVDIIVTIRKLVDFNTTMEKIKVYTETLKDRYAHEEWFKGANLLEKLESVKAKAESDRQNFNRNFLEKMEHLLENQKHMERFIKKFPTLRSAKYKDELQLLKNKMKNRLAKVKMNNKKL